MSSDSDGSIPPTRAARRAAERAAEQSAERDALAARQPAVPSATPAEPESTAVPLDAGDTARVPEQPEFSAMAEPVVAQEPGAVPEPAVPQSVTEVAAVPTPAHGETTPSIETLFGLTDPAAAQSASDALETSRHDESQTVAMPAAPVASAGAGSGKRRRKRPFEGFSVIGAFGEILLTAGVLMLLYLVWQLWYNDMVERGQQDGAAASLSQQWDKDAKENPAPAFDGAAPVIPTPVDGETFANLRIPRFGESYGAPLAGGVSKAKTLDKAGIGHYSDTQLPGQPGNFALAGHRNTHGAPLNQVANLRVGDAIVIETPEGWFTYRYRNSEYVPPTAVDVLNAVPREDSVAATQSVITLTSCNPIMSTAERIIAYGLFESFTPRADGAPKSLNPVEG
ncbi:LPXTG-site transpeptidase (sortase) family protein [Mycetocola sp. BIGb0189]|uniref:class E sortase n=1 Tax=Mycetocola sp. BIGb0189 TaxID=2940604 RepID=UPI0021674263|nr:class E sortase [Mycetocola sp. BIGb0189]MCS4277959.1 LPXTG-site transpeptidase (sortase) family protein [Mycetocola sp. BIGb0189]